MKDQQEEKRIEFDKWQDQWDKAMADGVFDDAPHVNQPSQDSVAREPNYFGMNANEPSEVINEVDAKYWKAISSVGAIGDAPDPIEAVEKLDEAEGNKDVADVAKAILQSPNQIRQHTAGKDQDLTPQSLGQTFSEEELESLHELKIKLHNAQSMLNAYEVEGKSTKTVESEITNLKNKVDELSDSLGQVFPLAISPQGD